MTPAAPRLNGVTAVSDIGSTTRIECMPNPIPTDGR
jgi:hypothetical protein